MKSMEAVTSFGFLVKRSLEFRERREVVAAALEVTTDSTYICGNGKSTDTPKLMPCERRAANPTLSLPEQIEFREDCVTLPPAISILVNYSTNIISYIVSNVRFV